MTAWFLGILGILGVSGHFGLLNRELETKRLPGVASSTVVAALYDTALSRGRIRLRNCGPSAAHVGFRLWSSANKHGV